ncbi:exodeoxyribonuclease I [Candidatus Saccharibacteria bacterium]|nr:exodeoxyribonuclease I [Candidatus Saccharibacteria bacterium]
MTFFFYDLETSGLDPKSDRIMQFAGQRTDQNLQPIGEPYNILVKLSTEVLPSPFAIFATGLTPQATLETGISEAQLAQILASEVFTEDTVALGYNNISFDDEFIRHLFFRNFHDPYTWQWAEGRSRWDLLDVVRLTRALRPDGINWVEKDGKQSNKLTDLSSANQLEHAQAHDALSDVRALIALAQLLRAKQPKIFDYLFHLRSKAAISDFVFSGQPFLFATGRYAYPSKTTAVLPLFPTAQGAYVYDLRVDPAPFLAMTEAELTAHLAFPYQKRPADYQPLPVKELRFNRCPALAPLAVLRPEDAARLHLDPCQIAASVRTLEQDPDFAQRLEIALARPPFPPADDPDQTLYESFIPDSDQPKMAAVRAANARTLADFDPCFTDPRLAQLLPLYKARNFPAALTKSEAELWQAYRTAKLNARLPAFQSEIAAARQTATARQKPLLKALTLWLDYCLS